MANKEKKTNVGQFISKWASVIATALLFVFFSVAMPSTFPTVNNITSILRSVAITCVIGIGLTINMASGGFDLSVGMMASLANTLCMSFIIWFNFGTLPAILCATLICVLFAVLSFTITVKFKVPEMLTTLSMQFVLSGIATTYAGAASISAVAKIWWSGELPTATIPDFFTALGKAPLIIIVMLVCVVLVHVFLNYTKYGRYFYAVGDNRTAAKLSGLPVTKYRYLAKIMACVFISLGGILVGARTSSATISSASGQLMPAMAAVIVGRSVAGAGKPNALGTLVGALLIGMLENGLIMIGVPYYVMDAVKGVVLIIALAIAYVNGKEEA